MVAAHRTRATALPQLRRVSSTIGEQHPAVPRVFRIRRGIEQIAAEEGGEWEHERVARPEEMDGLRRIQAFLRRDDDPNEVLEAIGLEQGNNAADRADGDTEGGDLLRASLAEHGLKSSHSRFEARPVL